MQLIYLIFKTQITATPTFFVGMWNTALETPEQRTLGFTSPLTFWDASQQPCPFSRSFTALLYEKTFNCYYLCKATTLPKLRLEIIFSAPKWKNSFPHPLPPLKTHTHLSSRMLQLKEQQDEDPRGWCSHSNLNTQHNPSKAAALVWQFGPAELPPWFS